MRGSTSVIRRAFLAAMMLLAGLAPAGAAADGQTDLHDKNDESTLAFTANSPLCGADRIIWASDYPHPDAKFPGVTEELAEALEGLSFDQQQAITSESATALYGIG